MVRTILLPVDGSPGAEVALQLGGEFASLLNARLVLVQPLDTRARPATGFPTDPVEDPRALLACRTARARTYLQALAARLHARFPMLRVGATVPFGPLPEAIIDQAQLEHADIIVCAMRLGDGPVHEGHAEGAGIGGLPASLARRAGVPVLLVPHTARVTGGPVSAPRSPRILVPLSGSAASEAVLPFVVQLANRLEARVTVLHVITAKEASGDGGAFPGAAEAAGRVPTETGHGRTAGGAAGRYLTWATAAGYCREVAGWLQQHGVPADVELRAGTPVEEIAIAALSGADMVALGLDDAPSWCEPYRGRQTVHAVGRCGVPVLLSYSRRASSTLAPAPDSTASTAGFIPGDACLPVGR